MWRLIGLTLPDLIEPREEIQRVVQLLESGTMEFFHLRKPEYSEEQIRQWLELFPQNLVQRLCLQDCIHLASEFGVGGVHLNRRNGFLVPQGFKGRVSTSCHSFGEARYWKERVEYYFLSPIYNSTSKQGYGSGFGKEDLKAAFQSGLLDKKAIALSGVRFSKLKELEEIGFSSAAMLGSLWHSKEYKK